jgi:hypothetical protein
VSLWWLWGDGIDTPSVGEAEANYPSLWSGGVEWNAADIGDGTQGYWQTSPNAAARTGKPNIAIAVGGTGVTNTFRSANWQLGRTDWFSTLTPSSASFEVEGAVSFEPMATVVIGVMSDTTDEHSDSLWVGYVDTISETTETSGRIVTSVQCVDVVGLLGQAQVTEDITINDKLPATVEALAAAAGVPLSVDDRWDSGSLLSGTLEAGNTYLSGINTAEQSNNTMLVLLGNGKLAAFARDSLPLSPIDLDADDPPAEWTRSKSPTSVINDWVDGAASWGTHPTDAAASIATYGLRAYTADIAWLVGSNYDSLVGSDVLLDPRWQLTNVRTPIRDLGQPTLFLDPLDAITLDEQDWQVLAVQHSVEPGHRWTVTFSGDLTIEDLIGD